MVKRASPIKLVGGSEPKKDEPKYIDTRDPLEVATDYFFFPSMKIVTTEGVMNEPEIGYIQETPFNSPHIATAYGFGPDTGALTGAIKYLGLVIKPAISAIFNKQAEYEAQKTINAIYAQVAQMSKAANGDATEAQKAAQAMNGGMSADYLKQLFEDSELSSKMHNMLWAYQLQRNLPDNEIDRLMTELNDSLPDAFKRGIELSKIRNQRNTDYQYSNPVDLILRYETESDMERNT